MIAADEEMRRLRQIVVAVNAWMMGPESEDIYQGLSPHEKLRFNRQTDLVGRVRTGLFDVPLDALANRASAQMERILAATGDVRARIEGRRRRVAGSHA